MPVGDLNAELTRGMYDDLRRLAYAYFRRARGCSLQPTELVNEACVQLLGKTRACWESPAHFKAVAARKLWQVLVDYLRRRNAKKRGGNRQRISLERSTVSWMDQTVEMMDLAEALDSLSAVSERARDVIILRCFGRLTSKEAADALTVSVSTVEKDYRFGLNWLNRHLAGYNA